MTYCCPVREFLLVGIIGERTNIVAPVEMADFVIEWEPKIIVRIKYCPFCGTELGPEQDTRIQPT